VGGRIVKFREGGSGGFIREIDNNSTDTAKLGRTSQISDEEVKQCKAQNTYIGSLCKIRRY
jgi:hypothetical protein